MNMMMLLLVKNAVLLQAGNHLYSTYYILEVEIIQLLTFCGICSIIRRCALVGAWLLG